MKTPGDILTARYQGSIKPGETKTCTATYVMAADPKCRICGGTGQNLNGQGRFVGNCHCVRSKRID